MSDSKAIGARATRTSKVEHTAGDPPEAETVLSVRHIQTEFVTRGTVVRAVRDVSFDVKRAQKVGIVGESGSGKSALALSILGLIEPPGRVTGGSVWLNGREVPLRDDRRMGRVRGREIGLVFQDPMTALDPVQSIGDQVAEGIRRHQRRISRKAVRRMAVQLLQDVEIPMADHRLDDYPHQYSGGMRQRIMIAIALANSPDVLIADEPTTALDVITQAQIMDLLERLVAEHHTAVILITHNLGLVAEFCDVVQVMYAGRLVERSGVDDIFDGATHPYTEALLRSVPRSDHLESGPLPSISGAPPNLAALPRGCAFEPRCPIGHGREVCIQEQPMPILLGPPGAEMRVECHFASERYERARAEGETR
ncbi:MAG: transporter ATP-binding protein [Chloroflexi bacterium]|nr:transporter ATP-binding protein [Chloroflexota bacterium]